MNNVDDHLFAVTYFDGEFLSQFLLFSFNK